MLRNLWLISIVVPAALLAQSNQATQELWNALKKADAQSIEFSVAQKSGDKVRIRAAWQEIERNTEDMKKAITAGADVDYVAPDGTSAWSFITERTGYQAESFLVPNSKGLQNIRINGLSPLLMLLQFKYEFSAPAMEQLLAKGVDPNGKYPDGKSALQTAINLERGSKKAGPFQPTIQELVQGGADVANLTPADEWLLWEIGYSYTKYYKTLIAKGLSPEITDANGCTPLVFAAKNNKWPGVDSLLEVGANINARDKSGNTAIMYLVKTPLYRKEDIERLINAGADLSLKNNQGQTSADIFHSVPEVKKAIKAGYQEYADAENALIDLAKLFPKNIIIGAQIGKVFSVDGKNVEITGHGIGKLTQGTKILIKSGSGNISGTVSEVLHTKAKAKITGKGSVEKGDPVHLAK